MRLFIINDSDIVVWRLLVMLHDIPGIELVGRAASAEQAQDQLGALDPDVVILDLQLAGGNGLRVLDTVGQLRRKPLMIALGDADVAGYQEQALLCGADHYFDKNDGWIELYRTLARYGQMAGDTVKPLWGQE